MSSAGDGSRDEGLLCGERLGGVFADRPRDLYAPVALVASCLIGVAAVAVAVYDSGVSGAAWLVSLLSLGAAVNAGVVLGVAAATAHWFDLSLGRLAPAAIKMAALVLFVDVTYFAWAQLLSAGEQLVPFSEAPRRIRAQMLAWPAACVLAFGGPMAMYFYHKSFRAAELLMACLIVARSLETFMVGRVMAAFAVPPV